MNRTDPLPDLAWTPERAGAFGAMALELWQEYLTRLPELPVRRAATPAEVRAAVTRPVPDDPLPDDELFAHLRTLALENCTHTGHSGFMAYITGAGTVPGAPAALLAAGFNQNAGGWFISPGATEVETNLLTWFADRFGLPAGASGAFVAGGATANLMALTAARDHLADHDVRRDGVAAGRPMAIYASEDAHDTIDRAADLLGLGTAAVRRIPTDQRLRMPASAVAAAIEADRAAGVQPLVVVGTAGTTEFGAIDPLEELAEVAATHGCWLHVDAAYGGPAAMTAGLRGRFTGIERADSITCDPHKWLNTPISSSLVLFRDPETQYRAFTLETDYTSYDTEVVRDTVQRYQWTPQFTRPFDALPVWVSLLAHGWGTFERRITHDVALAGWLHHRVIQHPELEPTIAPELSIVGFRYVPPDLRDDPDAAGYLDDLNERILYALHDDGRVFPSNARHRGRYVLRACLLSFRTEADDVDALIERTVAIGRDLHRARSGGRQADPATAPRRRVPSVSSSPIRVVSARSQ
ncbi:pyridoxal phosphate-dependent decarboxylase family protein [Nitriliruptor alkaliphilus]|uniref:pyridoxal phosphate-dependent decarboxylase family protein n=1 Tax=Nitriliruptor alkaliphilus TaxID=427918 RepID=UPI0006971E65|nr:pyridoxal-dependent decarboxylase [Nitriliruptor alkaliphilus]